MDGFQLASTVRSEEAFGLRMPIFALTANAMKDTAERCAAHGMDDCLIKPVTLAVLGKALEKWLRVATPVSSSDTLSKKLS
jgi:CheY-like chemotaxis protein